jgi:tetratricopeptide (TPR) repeat protein
VGIALLVEYFNELPREDKAASRRRVEAALEKFKKLTSGRYTEGTLQRLLESSDTRARRAAVLALGMLGTMKSNALLAGMLGDEDSGVRQLAVDALWSLWFRADTEANNQELRRLQRLNDSEKKKLALDVLIQKAPGFAEAYNQRAILHYQLGELQKSIADCEKVLKLNPHHFGAQVGMAQCYMGLGKTKAALRAFRCAMKIHPGLEGVEDQIRLLEQALDEEGKKNEDR